MSELERLKKALNFMVSHIPDASEINETLKNRIIIYNKYLLS
jgi:hypothetical protein